MDEHERYEQIDLPFYRKEIAPTLPPEVLDFHVHIWETDAWKVEPRQSDAPESKYMVVQDEYTVEQLTSHIHAMFPDKAYGTVCFGFPSPAFDIDKSNSYVARVAGRRGLYPLLLAGRDIKPRSELERVIREQGFFGYKVYLNWIGNDYGHVTIEDMIGPSEMALANELKLAIMLHVPRDRRLADPEVQRGVRILSRDYPDASIILAHCGRAYLPDEMVESIPAIRNLQNVYLDTTMVMDPTVLQIAFENIDSRRVLFGTDLPISAMRGRRVYVMDHWVDVVLEGYPTSAYRVASDNMRATFMVYEIILAVRRAAEMAGLTAQQLRAIFHDNGMAILQRVMDGEQLNAVQNLWSAGDG